MFGSLSGKYPGLSYAPVYASNNAAHEAVLSEVYETLKPGKTYDEKKIVHKMTADTLKKSGLYRTESIEHLRSCGLLDALQAYAEKHNNIAKSKDSRYVSDGQGGYVYARGKSQDSRYRSDGQGGYVLDKSKHSLYGPDGQGGYVLDKSKHPYYVPDGQGGYVPKASFEVEQTLNLLDPSTFVVPADLPAKDERAARVSLKTHIENMSGKMISTRRLKKRMKRATSSQASSDQLAGAQVETVDIPNPTNQGEANSMIDHGRSMIARGINWQGQLAAFQASPDWNGEQSTALSQVPSWGEL